VCKYVTLENLLCKVLQKMDLKDIGSGGVGRVNLAQGRNHCFAVMNSVFHGRHLIS
jgi:hypothetical protein